MAECNSSVHLIALCIFFSLLITIFSSSTVEATGESKLSWIPTRRGQWEGSIAECIGEEELDMDSEIHRRILQTTRYISYAALQRGSVPCSHRGATYYNCQPGAEANAYTRGCNAITRCRHR
ncbi:rapid alkalinization factor-like [Jatropha curcas]|nr:rapid alkalinization factor-like [Jatropha curcas]